MHVLKNLKKKYNYRHIFGFQGSDLGVNAAYSDKTTQTLQNENTRSECMKRVLKSYL